MEELKRAEAIANALQWYKKLQRASAELQKLQAGRGQYFTMFLELNEEQIQEALIRVNTDLNGAYHEIKELTS